MIYIASPYSSPVERVRQERFYRVRSYAILLLQKGQIAFSPIVYGHQFTMMGFPGDHLAWLDFNEHMLLTATEMHLLMLPGWEGSSGVKHELDFCDKHGINVVRVEPTLGAISL